MFQLQATGEFPVDSLLTALLETVVSTMKGATLPHLLLLVAIAVRKLSIISADGVFDLPSTEDTGSNSYSLGSINDLQPLLQDFQDNANASSFLLMLAVIEDDSCEREETEHSKPWLDELVAVTSNSHTKHKIPLLNIQLQTDDSRRHYSVLLEALDLKDSPPTLFLVTANRTSSYLVPWTKPLWVLPWIGSWLRHGIRGNHSVLTESEFVPRELSSLEDVDIVLRQSNFVEDLQQMKANMIPTTSAAVVVHYICSEQGNEVFTEFSRNMFGRPHLIFFFVRQCNSTKQEGLVEVWKIEDEEGYTEISNTTPTHFWSNETASNSMDLSTFLLSVASPDVFVLSDRLHAAPVALAIPTQAVFLDVDSADLGQACAKFSPLNMACVQVSVRTEQRVISTLQLKPQRLTIVDSEHRLYHQPDDVDAETFLATYDQYKPLYPNASFSVQSGNLRWLDAGSAFLSPSQQKDAVYLAMHPTCGHCQRILPLTRRLGELLASLGWNLPLYVVNVMEVPGGIAIDWVPSLVYNGTSQVVLDESFRHEHDMLEWIVSQMDRAQVSDLYAKVSEN